MPNHNGYPQPNRITSKAFLSCQNPANLRQYSHLYRGVYPFLFPQKKPDFKEADWQEDVDGRLKWGIKCAIDLAVLNEGEMVVCVQGWRGGKGHTNTIRVVPAKEDLGLSGE